ncbi:Kelch-like protein 38 [Tetrabaena socialis]|uniref:Kelch-like protein 38 n=1 Tax=Tetrabaena socialis TaxID=47790 RepID=A0A2J8A1A8_9CHLO|nr:Kelch-like protein 38 [Tetrabaena socialis]|eukprot:PNH06278.1 Kelch-like protein 38 [Tetrabaena socialis]
MNIPSCIVPITGGHCAVCGAVSRPMPGSGEGATQTLLVCGNELRPLKGADSRGRLTVGPPLRLPASRDDPPVGGIWDTHSSALYLAQGSTILRVGSDDTVAVVVGALDEAGDADGRGRAARFRDAFHLASDGAGALYVCDDGRIRKLQLPGGPGQRGNQGAAFGPQLAAAGGPGAAGGGAQEAENEVVVSTLLTVDGGYVAALAFHSDSCSLLYATSSAVYRLPLGAASAAPVLLAGSDEEEEPPNAADGRGLDARFYNIMGLVVGGEGAVLIADHFHGEGLVPRSMAVRRLAADGTVSTVAADIPGIWHSPSILPNGYLALCSSSCSIGRGGPALHVLDLGLKPQGCRPTVRAPAGGPPPRTLPADLRALLDRQPDGTSDVTILVGGRAFPAHRGVLCARSDYFQQRLGGGFADGGEQQLDLPEADPDAFEVVVRFVYTDDAADIPAAQAQAVAELADRLLLPELARQAAVVVEASVAPGTVVGLLLWAEARGPAFSELLARLKAWYVENQRAVAAAAPNTLKRLADGSPG